MNWPEIVTELVKAWLKEMIHHGLKPRRVGWNTATAEIMGWPLEGPYGTYNVVDPWIKPHEFVICADEPWGKERQKTVRWL